MVSAQYLIILTAVEAVIYTFHGSISLLLICKRKTTFKGAFYDIFRIVLVADLVTFVLILISSRIPLLSPEFFKKDYYIPSVNILITAYFIVIQYLGHMLMAFNRFTLLWFPVKYEWIWRRNWYTPILFLLPIGHLCYRFHEHAIFSFSPGNTVAMVYKNPAMPPLIFSIAAAIFITTTFIAAIFNGLTLIKFYFYKQSSNNTNIKEKRLLFMNCIIFVAQVMRTTYSLSRQIFVSDVTTTAFLIAALPYITDIFALTGSLSLLLLSPSTRKEYMNFFLCKTSSPINSISVKVITISNKPQNKWMKS